MKNSTIVMFGIVAAVAMLSAAVVLPIQQASASADTIIKLTQKSKASASGFSSAFACNSLDIFSTGGGPRCQNPGPG
jgi:hypothetical protein